VFRPPGGGWWSLSVTTLELKDRYSSETCWRHECILGMLWKPNSFEKPAFVSAWIID
jgi:hypothetical protein